MAGMKNTAVLLLDCPDRKGIVAAVTNCLLKHDANILHADQHQDSEVGLFFMRVEWDLDSCRLNLEQFERELMPIASSFQMRWKLLGSRKKTRAAIFVSKELHCLADLLQRHASGELECEVPLVISNHPVAEKLARFHGLEFHLMPVTPATKAETEARELELLQRNHIDLVVLARYMQVLSPAFVARFPERIINVHHSFLPAFSGAKPYHQAFARGVKLIGATSHYVTDELDEGPIIEQDVMRITHRDGIEDLTQKGRDLEKVALSRAMRLHIGHRILVYGKKTVIFD